MRNGQNISISRCSCQRDVVSTGQPPALFQVLGSIIYRLVGLAAGGAIHCGADGLAAWRRDFLTGQQDSMRRARYAAGFKLQVQVYK